MLFLSETHLPIRAMERINDVLGYRHMFVVPSSGELGLSGGLAFLWSDKVSATLGSFSIYHIDMDGNGSAFQNYRLL